MGASPVPGIPGLPWLVEESWCVRGGWSPGGGRGLHPLRLCAEVSPHPHVSGGRWTGFHRMFSSRGGK